MDPISQACFGASLSQSFNNDKSRQISALIIGALAGMAPDLDILIRSDTDPLLFLEYHRQFTHSLIFIPVGALLCALTFYPFMFLKQIKTKLSFKAIYLFSFLGFATHGMLDACTSYGTQLFWPFSNERVAWNTVSIVDPLFTLPVIILISVAAYKNHKSYARIAFIYAVVFLSLGLIQKQRAENVIQTLTQQRGHKAERVMVKPSFANRHVWKTIYEYNGRYYVDAARLLWDTNIIEGTSVKKLKIKRDFWWLDELSQQAIDIERFRWFSDDFLAFDENNPNTIMDMRYSFLPHRIDPMWHIKVRKKTMDQGNIDSHVKFEIHRKLDKKTRNEFMQMVF